MCRYSAGVNELQSQEEEAVLQMQQEVTRWCKKIKDEKNQTRVEQGVFVCFYLDKLVEAIVAIKCSC